MSNKTIRIDGVDCSFGRLGRKFRLSVADKIRTFRRDSFRLALSSVSVDSAPVAAQQISASIDAYMSSVIITDSDVTSWLQTPDGFYFAFLESFSKANPGASPERADELHDAVDHEAEDELREFWGRSMNALEYDRIINSVREDAERYFQLEDWVYRAIRLLKNDENVEAFRTWLQETGNKVDGMPLAEQSDDSASEEDAPDKD